MSESKIKEIELRISTLENRQNPRAWMTTVDDEPRVPQDTEVQDEGAWKQVPGIATMTQRMMLENKYPILIPGFKISGTDLLYCVAEYETNPWLFCLVDGTTWQRELNFKAVVDCATRGNPTPTPSDPRQRTAATEPVPTSDGTEPEWEEEWGEKNGDLLIRLTFLAGEQYRRELRERSGKRGLATRREVRSVVLRLLDEDAKRPYEAPPQEDPPPTHPTHSDDVVERLKAVKDKNVYRGYARLQEFVMEVKETCRDVLTLIQQQKEEIERLDKQRDFVSELSGLHFKEGQRSRALLTEANKQIERLLHKLDGARHEISAMAAVHEAEVERLAEENERGWKLYAQVQADRSALLDITSTDGLSSSEWVMRTAVAEKKIKALRAQRDTLRKFFEAMARDVWGLDTIDGGGFQDTAEKLGLIVLVPADEAFRDKHGEDEMYVWEWHPLAPSLAALKATGAVTKDEPGG